MIVFRLHRLPKNPEEHLQKVNLQYALFSKEPFHVKKVDGERFRAADFRKS